MIGEWLRFGLCAAFMLAGLFIMVVSIIGLFRFDFALQRIHAAALGDTLSLLLFTVGILIAVGFHAVMWKLILVLVLVIFGGGKLAGVGKALGQSIREFKKEVKTDDKDGEAAASETNEAEKK